MSVRRMLAGMIGLMTALSLSAVSEPATAVPEPPQPVIEPTAADPGVFRDTDGQYYAYLTGGNVRLASAPTPQGPWVHLADQAMERRADWVRGTKAMWAPDVDKTSAGYVLWYAAHAKDFTQRCIGAAVSDSPTGPFEPLDTPLICPVQGGEDPVEGRPVPGSGVIDPAPFVDSDGRRYLTYKTQRTPATLRMIELTEDGLHVAPGAVSKELFRHDGSIENPVMVKRGDQYLLFASANWYDQCRYATVYRRSTDLWSFADKDEHVLLDQGNTGICGPGGADLVMGGDEPDRMFLHGWLCPSTNWQPCDFEGRVTEKGRRRAVYSAVVTWGDDGATPAVPAFLPPLS